MSSVSEVARRLQECLDNYVPDGIVEPLMRLRFLFGQVLTEDLGYKCMGRSSLQWWKDMDNPRWYMFRYHCIDTEERPVYGEFLVDASVWDVPPVNKETP